MDCGNSRLKWGLVDTGGNLVRVGRCELSALSGAIAGIGGGISSLDGAFASVVAGEEIAKQLAAAVDQRFACATTVVRTQDQNDGLVNGYEMPEALGVDRWLVMLGARQVSDSALLVVDAGTAMTVDAVLPTGRHLGGYIVPGYSTQIRALGRHTAALQGVSGSLQPVGWGRGTDQAIVSGVLSGLAALVERCQVELESRVADTCDVLLTGGDAGRLVPYLHLTARVDEYLLFRGLWAMASPGTPLRLPS